MSPLRKQLEDDLVLRGYSPRTREAYVGAVVGLAKHYRRSPERISREEIKQYLLHLLQERKLSASSCNVAASGLQFFYRVTLKQGELECVLPRPKLPSRLPHILSREEVARLIQSTENLKHRAMLMSAYGEGLRVSELCHLRVGDIDSSRMAIRVEQGKGAKDRYTLLSERLLSELRRYWHAHRPKQWLFPGKGATEVPIAVITAQRIFGSAKERAGIAKDCGIHALRHAFATHLLEAGVDVHTIQRLMGHGHIGSTLRYFHLADRHLAATPSPLELLDRADLRRL
jgi:integrase/recombinase XerD